LTLKQKAGFSLIEVIIAMGLLGVGILTVLGLFGQLTRDAQKATATGAGVLAAESVLNRTVSEILSDVGPISRADFFANDSPPSAPIQGTITANRTIMTYEITYRTVQDTAGGGLGAGLPENRTKHVELNMWWWTDNPDSHRAGYGFLRTSASKLVNEQTEI
jgi:prepilin-type N-terminal cleavage/methylation domain-containing protein